MKGKGGFTLLELLIVIIILGILAATGIPIYTGVVEKARAKEAYTTINAIKEAEARWCAQNAAGNFFAVGATSNFIPTGIGNLDVGWNTRYWNFAVTTPANGNANIVALRTTGTAYNITCGITNENYQGTWSGNHPGFSAP